MQMDMIDTIIRPQMEPKSIGPTLSEPSKHGLSDFLHSIKHLLVGQF